MFSQHFGRCHGCAATVSNSASAVANRRPTISVPLVSKWTWFAIDAVEVST